MAKKLKVNKDNCIMCGLCVSTYPEVFKFDDEGKAEAEPVEVEDSQAEEAIASCPGQAIEEA